MTHSRVQGGFLTPPRSSVLAVAAVASLVLVTGCGSSTNDPGASKGTTVADASGSPSSRPSSTGSSEPTVGPTNPAQSPTPQPAVINLRVVKQDGATIVIAPVRIHGKTYSFVVDTGATATVITSSFARELGLRRTTQEVVPLAGIGGQAKAYLTNISDWQIGRAKVPTSTVAVADLTLRGGLVGFLGSDVLSTFGKITIDYAHEKATLG